MQDLQRRVITGAAVVGSGAIFLTSVVVAPTHPDTRVFPAELTAFSDLGTDLSTIADNFLLAPAVGIQQEIVDLIDILTTFNFAGLVANLQDLFSAITFFQPFFMPNGTFETDITTGLVHTLDFPHLVLIPPIVGLLPFTVPLLQLAASPISTVLMGLLGPFLSPVAEVIDAVESLLGGDFRGALDHLLAAPGSIFTGGDLNLDFLVSLVSDLLPLPAKVTKLDFAFGGLFSPGDSNAGTVAIGVPGEGPVENLAGLAGSYTDIHGDTVPAVGGSLLNAVGLTVNVPLINFTTGVTGVGVGPIGALLTLQQTLGEVLGMNWDGTDAVAHAPLIGLDPFELFGSESLFASGAAVSSGTTAAGDARGEFSGIF